MYPAVQAQENPNKPAFVIAETGESMTYAELDRRSNRCAQLLYDLGLRPGDCIAVLMENHPSYFEICWAAQRSGLYYTAISTRLTPGEAEYIVNDCGAKALFSSETKAELATALAATTPAVRRYLAVGSPPQGFESYEEALSAYPAEALEEELEGADMLYSSGTTGRPKGVKIPLSRVPAGTPPPLVMLVTALYGASPDSVYLSPAPLYHAAPLRFNLAFQRVGATCVVMQRFDPAAALALIEKHRVTHSQWVPTMFTRMLKLPEPERLAFDVSSLQVAIHAAAPCPIPVKQSMIEWWGPVLQEYYGGTEGNGFTAIDSEAWLSHKGSVGKSLSGEIHILDDEGNELPTGEAGTVYFAGGGTFEYHNDPEKTAQAHNDKGWSTMNDVGYVDEEGYLYLTDRKANMIISGGVNIYPQEAENLLATHPKVLDAAVFGVPNEDLGEEVKAVITPMDMAAAGPELEAELIDYCRANLAKVKCPRSIDFEAELPRHPTGKLYKRLLRDRYWQGRENKLV